MAYPVLGITGKAGSGKDTAAEFFREYGIPEINVDRIGHAVLEAESAAVAEAFGESILENGVISRQRLGTMVFADVSARNRLEAILHPAMIAEVKRCLGEISGAATINAALLYQMGLDRLCGHVLFVSAPESIRAERLLSRPGMDSSRAQRILAAQKNINPAGNSAETSIENASTVAIFRTRLETFADDYFGGDTYALRRQTKKADVYPQPG